MLEGNPGRDGDQKKNGVPGKDIHFGVPLGTSIYNIKTSSEHGNQQS